MNLLSSSLPVDGRIREILVRNIVEGGRPISICEDPLFYETLQAGSAAVLSSSLDSPDSPEDDDDTTIRLFFFD